MSQPYIGEIRMFAGSFPPNGWMFCEGQLIPIAENDALFILLGTTYGGDGQETFGLPDLRGRVPVHRGNGLTRGEKAGTESVTLTTQQIPLHTHPALASADSGTSKFPSGLLLSRAAADFYTTDMAPQPLNAQSIGPVGGSQPHENMQPYLCINFIISLFGIFPTPT
jgi:microcystin-dependent protein